MSRAVLVLGGAGFVGSHVAARFVAGGDRITVLDGLAPGTGASADNPRSILGQVELVTERVEDALSLADRCARSDVVVDAMAFTSHHVALREPLRDLAINGASHLHPIGALGPRQRVIYLGSRGQYGRPGVARIVEETPMVPVDVQGIHKLAAESYYRVYAGVRGFSAAALRFPNCFGPHQQTGTGDIGLLGGFVRELLAGATVEVYGARRRQIVYAPDVAEVTYQLAARMPEGFTAWNLGGRSVAIDEIVRRLSAIVGRGGFVVRDMPKEIARLDVGEAELSDDRLRGLLGALPETDLDAALTATVEHWRRGRA